MYRVCGLRASRVENDVTHANLLFTGRVNARESEDGIEGRRGERGSMWHLRWFVLMYTLCTTTTSSDDLILYIAPLMIVVMM